MENQKNSVDSKIKVHINITDFDVDPEEITEIIGIQPTKTRKAGDPVPRTIIKTKMNGWLLYAPCDPFKSDLDEQVEKLLEIIEPYKDNFSKLPKGTHIELSCFLYSYKERPIIGFSAESIKKLAEIGASIDVDSYDFSSSNDE
jgi:hypothetical protein